MSVRKDLDKLKQANVIDDEIAARILAYYNSEEDNSPSRLFIIFGILGAILTGLGVILIFTYNWDSLSRFGKTVIAFLPVLVGQGVCAYTLLKRSHSPAWKESSATFLYLAVGGCIALVSQIYNIPGNTTSFMLLWTLLGFPLVYLMPSSMASLMYITGITYFTCQVGYFDYPAKENYLYWPLLGAILPYYLFLSRRYPSANFTTYHHWFIPISLTIVLGTVADDNAFFMFIAYMAIFGLFYAIGSHSKFLNMRMIENGFKCIGWLGTIVILLITSFHWFWKEVREGDWIQTNFLTSPEMIIAALLTIGALFVTYWNYARSEEKRLDPFSIVLIAFILVFVLGRYSPIALMLINLIILSLGVYTIRKGVKEIHLGILNLGLLIVASLIICRFFDTALGLVLKGMLFVLVGIGFFSANYWLIRKKKLANDQQ